MQQIGRDIKDSCYQDIKRLTRQTFLQAHLPADLLEFCKRRQRQGPQVSGINLGVPVNAPKEAIDNGSVKECRYTNSFIGGNIAVFLVDIIQVVLYADVFALNLASKQDAGI